MTEIVSTSQHINLSSPRHLVSSAASDFSVKEPHPSPFSRLSQPPHVTSDNAAATEPSQTSDPDLEVKVKKACERVSENLHICANEPSLALYRLTEHVRKALPPTVESRSEVKRLGVLLRSAHEDAEDELLQVKRMEASAETLSSAVEILKNAILLQQQIKHDQQRRCPNRETPSSSSSSSMYQRLSAHITSVELPDFATELKETARETANKVENVLNRSTSVTSEKKVPVTTTTTTDRCVVSHWRSSIPSQSVECNNDEKDGRVNNKSILDRSQSVNTIGRFNTFQL